MSRSNPRNRVGQSDEIDPFNQTKLGSVNQTKFSIVSLKTQATPNPGGFESLGISVLYDPAKDANAGCAPFLDAQVQPLSFAGAKPGTAWITMNTLDAAGSNYQINGTLSNDLSFHESLHVNCHVILPSNRNPKSTAFAGIDWITSLFKINATTVVGFIHNEFYGGSYPGPLDSTYSAVESAISTDGGNNFSGMSLIAKPSFPYDAGYLNSVWNGKTSTWAKPTGFFVNSGAVKGNDGYYYMMLSEPMPDGTNRICPTRNPDITKAWLWRSWDGSRYSVPTMDGADCIDIGSPVSPMYLGFNAYFNSYIMVGTMNPYAASSGHNQNFGYSLSTDLIHWSAAVDFEVPSSWQTGSSGWGNYNYPTLVDPTFLLNTNDMNQSSGAVTGQNPWLVFIDELGYPTVKATRLMKVQIHFSPSSGSVPLIAAGGLGCSDFSCGWVKGSGFTEHCQITLSTLDGSQVRSIANPVCASDGYLTFQIPADIQATYSQVLVTVTNSFGAWGSPYSLNIARPKPSVTAVGLGCSDSRCIWVNGAGFTDRCRVVLYADNWIALGAPLNVTCTDSQVTFRIPDSVYFSGTRGVRVTILNAAGFWNEPIYVPLRGL